MEFNPVYLEWLDHTSIQNSWIEIDEIGEMKPSKASSVGWIIEETDEYLNLASHLVSYRDEEEVRHGSGTLCIIKGCITKRVTLNHVPNYSPSNE